MGKIGSSILQSIDCSQLTAIVRKSLQRDSFQIRDWHMSQFDDRFCCISCFADWLISLTNSLQTIC